ncbi:MAG TPA: hypothetical protein VFV52_00570 [Bacilli bacterium]|nr:hypothetical protein [Bacilli bacterium]
MTVSEKYLELGLIGLGRTGETKGWFSGHYGAAMLAVYYMDREFDLPEHVQAGLVRNCESYLERFPDLFKPFAAEEADRRLLDKVVDALRANAERLSHSGHGLAFGFLGLKAFLDRPDMITPSIVDGFAEGLMYATKANPDRYWGIPNYFEFDPQEIEAIPEYRTLEDMAERALAECARIYPGKKLNGKMYHFTGEVEHGLTHGQALMEFERLGYGELTELSLPNHRIQMRLNRQIAPEVMHTEVKEPAFSQITSPKMWEKVYNDPHALKVPYAALYLIDKLPEEKRAEAERNVCKILSQMK